ncbi:MAG: transcriptional regulator, IclR family [Ramlibacter sp.]|nr:transcriptional regulator, IclR family [Ramlibacter sp.]
MMATADIDRRNWIAGLDKGLSILQAFDVDHSRLNASAAARLAGLSRSAARRHLMMLSYLGFLETDGKSFWLTPKVLRLGGAYLESARLPRAVQPYLQRLTAATQESAFFCVLDADEVVCVARNASERAAQMGYLPGSRIPPFVTSSGIVLLAALQTQQAAVTLAAYEVRPYTPHTITDKDALRRAIELGVAQGYALLEQQLEPGVRGIAVPVKNLRAETFGALSVTTRMGDETTAAAVRRLLPPLLQVAHEMRGIG